MKVILYSFLSRAAGTETATITHDGCAAIPADVSIFSMLRLTASGETMLTRPAFIDCHSRCIDCERVGFWTGELLCSSSELTGSALNLTLSLLLFLRDHNATDLLQVVLATEVTRLGSAYWV
jgi:hypothetical protein